MAASNKSLGDLTQQLISILEPLGFELYKFKVGWYNEQVSEKFALSYPYDTLAFVILSTPSMFETTFIPYIMRGDCLGTMDPIDKCMIEIVDLVREKIKEEMTIIHDYEIHPNRRPKILMQTAGHVSGAARYYQSSDVQDLSWKPKRKMFGVSVHPLYGGWFAFRSVIIFTEIHAPQLEKKEPPNIVDTDEKRIYLLETFNHNFKDAKFRDIIPTIDKYSDDQLNYFNTSPKQRPDFIKELVYKLAASSCS